MSTSRKQMSSYYKRKKIILLSLGTSMISLEHIITPQGLERITSQACKWMSQRDMNHHSNKSFIHRSPLAAGRPCHRWSVALQQAAPLVLMLEIWYRGWNGQGVIKIKRTTFVHTRNICSESWVACLRSFSKLSTKNDCQEGKKSAQYNQYKLHEHETEHAEGLVTSRSQFNAHSW